jgi:hypothetical protein
VAQPTPVEPVGYGAHIKPLFHSRDRQSMNWAFDLWPYEGVSEHADAILGKLRRGTRPCDGRWPGIGSTSSTNGGAMGGVHAASRQLVGSKP